MRIPSHLISWLHSGPVGTWLPRVASMGRMRVIIPQAQMSGPRPSKAPESLSAFQISALRLSRIAGE